MTSHRCGVETPVSRGPGCESGRRPLTPPQSDGVHGSEVKSSDPAHNYCTEEPTFPRVLRPSQAGSMATRSEAPRIGPRRSIVSEFDLPRLVRLPCRRSRADASLASRQQLVHSGRSRPNANRAERRLDGEPRPGVQPASSRGSVVSSSLHKPGAADMEVVRGSTAVTPAQIHQSISCDSAEKDDSSVELWGILNMTVSSFLQELDSLEEPDRALPVNAAVQWTLCVPPPAQLVPALPPGGVPVSGDDPGRPNFIPPRCSRRVSSDSINLLQVEKIV
ncbi:uncharacterized protein V6R79_009159 [Siganus canaliculatus]